MSLRGNGKNPYGLQGDKRSSFALFPVYCYNTMLQISQCCFDGMGSKKKNQSISHKILIPVAARYKAWVCGHSLAGFAGSNPARSTYEVCPENSRIYRVKIFQSYLEAIQPCQLQSTPLYSVCTAASVSSMF